MKIQWYMLLLALVVSSVNAAESEQYRFVGDTDKELTLPSGKKITPIILRRLAQKDASRLAERDSAGDVVHLRRQANDGTLGEGAVDVSLSDFNYLVKEGLLEQAASAPEEDDFYLGDPTSDTDNNAGGELDPDNYEPTSPGQALLGAADGDDGTSWDSTNLPDVPSSPPAPTSEPESVAATEPVQPSATGDDGWGDAELDLSKISTPPATPSAAAPSVVHVPAPIATSAGHTASSIQTVPAPARTAKEEWMANVLKKASAQDAQSTALYGGGQLGVTRSERQQLVNSVRQKYPELRQQRVRDAHNPAPAPQRNGTLRDALNSPLGKMLLLLLVTGGTGYGVKRWSHQYDGLSDKQVDQLPMNRLKKMFLKASRAGRRWFGGTPQRKATSEQHPLLQHTARRQPAADTPAEATARKEWFYRRWFNNARNWWQRKGVAA
ncbi:MAG: hypothetical protein PVJ92_00115 [Candidatus Dependentiae bacterium]|jgi:hypothetical protein